MRFLFSLLPLLLLFGSLYAQEETPKGRKPVLIRDDPNETKEEMVVEPNPRMAEENLRVGDFYFKRDNYKAAEERYREAVKYSPSSVQAYEKLIRTLEKQKAFVEAIAVCEEFLKANPLSKRNERFREIAADLREKNQKQDAK